MNVSSNYFSARPLYNANKTQKPQFSGLLDRFTKKKPEEIHIYFSTKTWDKILNVLEDTKLDNKREGLVQKLKYNDVPKLIDDTKLLIAYYSQSPEIASHYKQVLEVISNFDDSEHSKLLFYYKELQIYLREAETLIQYKRSLHSNPKQNKHISTAQ